MESEGQVEVCVNLTYPPLDSFDDTVRVNVFNNESSVYIPDGAEIACMLIYMYLMKLPKLHCNTLSVPDVFDRRAGNYPMDPLTDYEEQTESQNRIRNTFINATRRIVCYNQPVYNDERLELREYAGLQLSVQNASVSVDLVLVQEQYDNAAILILDDDSQLLLCRQFFACVVS